MAMKRQPASLLSTDHSTVLSRWLPYVPYLIHGLLDHVSLPTKQHFNWFSHLCRVHGHDQHRQTDRQTDNSYGTMRHVRLEIGEILHIFPSGTQSMGDRGSQKAYTGLRTGIYLQTKFGCDRSIVVDCRSWNDRQTSRQTSRNDNKAHSLRTWRNRQIDTWTRLRATSAAAAASSSAGGAVW